MENEIETGLRLFFWITTVIMLICVLGVVLLMLIYRNKMHNIYRKESETLLKVTLNIEKRERQRLASELHDSISGDLTAVQNFITILYRKEGDEFKKSIFSEVESTVSKVLSDIENVTFDLMPPMLESSGLISTLKSYFDRVRKWNEIAIHEQYDKDNIELSSSEAYEVYKIVQELVTNMIKHGKSKNVYFTIQTKENPIVLEIIDDGTSFDFYKSLKDPNGRGLKNITSRINHIEAELKQIPSEKGNKMQIHLKR